jgi:hypothetical protein
MESTITYFLRTHGVRLSALTFHAFHPDDVDEECKDIESKEAITFFDTCGISADMLLYVARTIPEEDRTIIVEPVRSPVLDIDSLERGVLYHADMDVGPWQCHVFVFIIDDEDMVTYLGSAGGEGRYVVSVVPITLFREVMANDIGAYETMFQYFPLTPDQRARATPTWNVKMEVVSTPIPSMDQLVAYISILHSMLEGKHQESFVILEEGLDAM